LKDGLLYYSPNSNGTPGELISLNFDDFKSSLNGILDSSNRLYAVRTQSYRLAFYFNGGILGETIKVPLNNFQDENGIEMTGEITLTFDGVNWSGSYSK